MTKHLLAALFSFKFTSLCTLLEFALLSHSFSLDTKQPWAQRSISPIPPHDKIWMMSVIDSHIRGHSIHNLVCCIAIAVVSCGESHCV